MNRFLFVILAMVALFVSPAALAADGQIEGTSSVIGIICVLIFVVAYVLVMGEEKLHLRKSKPVVLAAGIIWILIGLSIQFGWLDGTTPETAALVRENFKHNFLEFSELMLFLLVAMTYINVMEERKLFDALRAWLVQKGFTYRSLFWITGILAFFISPVADNLTTALLMCAVVMKVADGNRRFIVLACINIVVAANAGGAFSPFGDITTLMVWQAGVVEFTEFFALFLPSVINFALPALIMTFFIENKTPAAQKDVVYMEVGARRTVLLFLLTIATAVFCQTFLNLPPVLGMLTGLGYLNFFSYYLNQGHDTSVAQQLAVPNLEETRVDELKKSKPFDIFSQVARADWDTLLFFYGVVLCVGGLGFLGYLAMVSEVLYTQWDPTYANVSIGLISAVVDNIPVMFAVLTMHPEMSHGQWLLVTLTAGVGGSLLSVGSAAGVALMGAARGYYTFMAHLKWMPVIMTGYIASILVHLWVNSHLMQVFG